jgi:hypothetical protein
VLGALSRTVVTKNLLRWSESEILRRPKACPEARRKHRRNPTSVEFGVLVAVVYENSEINPLTAPIPGTG